MLRPMRRAAWAVAAPIRWAFHRPRRILLIYLALLLASHVVIAVFNPQVWTPRLPAEAEQIWLDLTVPRADGSTLARTTRVSLARWAPEEPDAAKPPVLLLHGSPSGGAGDWRLFAPLLAGEGYDVYALEAPGFGRSPATVPDFSILATAHLALAAQKSLGLERLHLIGWSFGGAVAIRMADLEPERVATVTLVGALAAQETEGSGDYYFEHAKYALGYGLAVVLPEFIPHFNLLAQRSIRIAFIRNFWDSDQRPMAEVMRGLQTPALILHGRRDFLVPAWGAELHHRLIPNARLVMMDATHFMPFYQPKEMASHVLPFLGRHDDPSLPPLPSVADYAPDPPNADRLGPFRIVHDTHWLALVALIILATFISEDATVIAVGLLIARGEIDAAVGFLGCFMGIAIGDGGLWAIGRFVGRPALHWPLLRNWLPEKALEKWGRAFDKHAVKAVLLARAIPGTRVPTYLAAGVLSTRAHRFLFWAVLAILVWTPLLLTLSAIVGPPILGLFEGVLGGPLALVAALIVVLVTVRTIEMLFTRIGRLRLRRAVSRPFRSEFWPIWAFYLPIAPWILYQALRRGPLTFTCVNPGVSNGGGVVGESKHEIIDGLIQGGQSKWIVPTALILPEDDHQRRAARVDSIIRESPEFGGYPVILKPDESQRGHAVKLARSHQGVVNYFDDMTRAAILQAYAPGPEEAGVFWLRDPNAGLDAPGRIYSITRKVFPKITGDGVRTLEELIWTHPRYRMQAEVFLKRFADQTDRVLAAGEEMRLGEAGNHCQGAIFLDGADLITPALERCIDEIARSYPNDGFDFGRFDVRYRSDDDLRRGERFVIVELNGAMSESTNVYDPRRFLTWKYAVLARQWGILYRLGALRRRAGKKPMSLAALISAYRDHYRGRPGSAIAD